MLWERTPCSGWAWWLRLRSGVTGRNEGQIPGEFAPEESAGGLAERVRGSKSVRHGRVCPLGKAAGALRKGGVGNSEGGCSSSREWLGTERVSVRAGSDDIADNSNRPVSGDIGVADSTRRTVPNPLCALFYRSPYRALRFVHVVIILFFFFFFIPMMKQKVAELRNWSQLRLLCRWGAEWGSPEPSPCCQT